MKKIIVFLSCIFFVSVSLRAQTFSINGFGGYTFKDQVNFGNVYAYVQESAHWGVSIEGISKNGSGIELLYQQQNTNVPLSYYNTGLPANKDNDQVIISYIMLNGLHYVTTNPHVQPYGGLGIGVGIASPQSGSSFSKFAWDSNPKFSKSQNPQSQIIWSPKNLPLSSFFEHW